MRFSIFAKILSGFSVLLLLMLASQSYSVFMLNSTTTRYAALLAGNQQLIDGIRSMQVDFKRQVQEWKNILLRGDEAADFEKYHRSFLQKYEEVQQQAARIQGLEMSQESLSLLQQFVVEHQRMQTAYLEAIQLLQNDEAHDVYRADRSVRGQDRPPTELLDTLSEHLQQETQTKNDTLQQQEALSQKLLMSVSVLLLVIALAIALLVARKISVPVKEIRDILKKVASGSVQVECSLRSTDEIGDLADSTRDIIAYVQEAAHVAEQVAGGELDIEIHPRSETDVLNYSLTDMVINLREMRTAIQQSVLQAEEQYNAIKAQNWSKDGLSQLSTSLADSHSLEKSCRIAIQTVARYVKAGQGVVYIYEPDKEELSLQASFAFTKRDGLSKHYTLGENIIGQVAQERKAILLKHADREERLINSALISHAPLNTYALPLVYNDELFGVIELASFEIFGAQEQEFLTQAADIMAIAVFSAQQRTRSEALLQQAQQAVREAEIAQQESRRQAQEAEEANVRLEEQQQQLQQQNEEFQQLTTQLKEQQQQSLQEEDKREQLAQSLEQERRLLRNLIDNLPDYIYAKDLQSRFILANLPLARSAGFGHPDELLGKTDFDLQPQTLAETYYRAEQNLMQSKQEIRDREETFESSETGEKTWLLTSKIPFQDQHGHVAGFIGIGRDITEYKRAKDSLQKLREHFEQQLQERSAHLLQEKEELAQRVRELESA